MILPIDYIYPMKEDYNCPNWKSLLSKVTISKRRSIFPFLSTHNPLLFSLVLLNSYHNYTNMNCKWWKIKDFCMFYKGFKVETKIYSSASLKEFHITEDWVSIFQQHIKFLYFHLVERKTRNSITKMNSNRFVHDSKF